MNHCSYGIASHSISGRGVSTRKHFRDFLAERFLKIRNKQSGCLPKMSLYVIKIKQARKVLETALVHSQQTGPAGVGGTVVKPS